MAKKNTSPLTQYGYPKPRQIRRQAKQLAAASVTPASQIRKQYGRAQTDASGFTQALVNLLGGQQAAYTGAANDALTQQQAIDSAAASRLGGVAPAYQGAQVETGALGDSAASRQVSQGEALRGYGAQQPGIAASRGALAQVGLTSAMQDALDQRRTQLHQAFQQALPQVQQNALSMATAAANIQQANQGLALQYAQLNQQNQQFNESQAQNDAHFWANLSAQYGGQGGVSAKGGISSSQKLMKAYGYTPTQWRAAVKDARTGADQAVFHKVPPDVYLQKAIQVNNIPPEIALNAVRVIYGGLRGANKQQNPGKWQVYQEYKAWLMKSGIASAQTRKRHDKTPGSRNRHRQ
jgi:hypothetical protein